MAAESNSNSATHYFEAISKFLVPVLLLVAGAQQAQISKQDDRILSLYQSTVTVPALNQTKVEIYGYIDSKIGAIVQQQNLISSQQEKMIDAQNVLLQELRRNQDRSERR